MKSTILSLASVPALAMAQMMMDVDVGMNGLVFDPDTLNVPMGTMINFHFYNPGNHSVAQSSFDSPCMPTDNAIFSGFSFGDGDPESSMMFSIMVNSTDPIWLYCSQGSHCQSGMAMAINPGDNTIDDYKSAAAMASENVSPDTVSGGVVAENMESSMPSGSSSEMSMMSTSSGMMSMSTGMSMSMSMSSGMMMPTSSGMGSSVTASGMAPAETTGAAIKNSQVNGVVGAAALGFLGALLA